MVALGGCAHADVTQLNARTFKIVYKVHNRSPQEALQGAVKRAAKVTLDEGGRYFVVLDSDGSERYTAATADGFGHARLSSRTTAALTFRIASAADGESRLNAYDACRIVKCP